MNPSAQSQSTIRQGTSAQFQSALDAAQNGQHDLALKLFAGLLSQVPDHALARYMLGAQFAQLGMHARAQDELERALVLDPSLTMARFQLGLVCMATGAVPRAMECFAEVARLPSTDALNWLGGGMTGLLEGRLDDARQKLARGIELVENNPSLAQDMRRVLDELNRAPASTP